MLDGRFPNPGTGRHSTLTEPAGELDVKVEDDREAQACYLRVSQQQVAHTVHVEDGVMVDVDYAGKPVGVEFLWERHGVPAEAL